MHAIHFSHRSPPINPQRVPHLILGCNTQPLPRWCGQVERNPSTIVPARHQRGTSALHAEVPEAGGNERNDSFGACRRPPSSRLLAGCTGHARRHESAGAPQEPACSVEGPTPHPSPHHRHHRHHRHHHCHHRLPVTPSMILRHFRDRQSHQAGSLVPIPYQLRRPSKGLR